MAVVEGSPAAEAGLLQDDQLVSVNGRLLAAAGSHLDGPPTREFVAGAEQIISEELGKGEIALRVTGARGDRTVRFQADVGCAVNVELVSNDDVNAWADGKRVLVTAAILDECRSDADLALVIAHELAHNLLHHGSATLLAESPESAPAAATMMSAREEAADELGVALATAAAYDLSGAEGLLVRLMAPRGSVAATHPTIERRLALLKIAIEPQVDERGSVPTR
jgi:predicted Zn-dependent protease